MNTESQVININGQSFLDASLALEEIGNNLVEYANNIIKEIEKNNSNNILSSIRLEKSCNGVKKVGSDCLAIGDISKDIGNIYDSVAEPSMGRSL